jgi:hypothetical protein
MLRAMREAERMDRRYGWYLATAASWFAGVGLQQVMLPWLVVGELRASAAWTGAVQMATMLPSVFLLLPGGAVADRRDPRALLTGLHLVAALPALALGLAAATERLSLAIVLVAAAAIGTLNALSNPARDTLLSEVAGRDIARAVTGLTIAQFASQGLGMAAAGAARWLGTAPVLLAQAVLVALGAALVRGTPPRSSGAVRHAAPGEYLAGLRFVLGSPLRAVLVLTCGIGFLFSASYNVALPVLVRDVYGGDVRDVSIVMLTFPIGTIAGSFVLLSRGGIRRKGRALLLSLAIAAAGVIACGAGLPFPFVVCAGLVWRGVPQHGPHALPGARARSRARARARRESARLHGGGPARRAALRLRRRRARPARRARRLRRRHARAREPRYAGHRRRADGVKT